jgi:hypothetical protein
MKTRLALTLALFSLCGAATAHATEVGGPRRRGIGFAVGDPTGVVGKLFLDSTYAIDAGIGFWDWGYGHCRNRGWDYCGGQAISLHADYLWHETLTRSTVKLDWHLGAGPRVIIIDDPGPDGDTVGLAARMPIGLDLTFNRPHFLEVFFELAPALYVLPGLDFDVDAQLGVRFYF